MVQLEHAYAFMGGAFVGRFTGILPSLVISGILLYVADPSLFTTENVVNIKNITMAMLK